MQMSFLTAIENIKHMKIKTYSKTCVKRPLKNRQNKDLNNNW